MDRKLTAAIRTSFADSNCTYGARRVRRDLHAWGHPCGVHRVQRLMSAAQLVAGPKRRRRPCYNGVRVETALAPDLLDRQFGAMAPNCKWAAEFTYRWTVEGWLYVAVVLDLFSRRVVGWSMSTQMTAQLVTDAMMRAIWRRGPKEALLHLSERRSQYTSEQFQQLLAHHGVTCSMSRSDDCWDNAAMESSFSTLKIERRHRKTYTPRDEVKTDMFDYIERFYNLRRRYSTLGYLSPAGFERQAGMC